MGRCGDAKWNRSQRLALSSTVGRHLADEGEKEGSCHGAQVDGGERQPLRGKHVADLVLEAPQSCKGSHDQRAACVGNRGVERSDFTRMSRSRDQRDKMGHGVPNRCMAWRHETESLCLHSGKGCAAVASHAVSGSCGQ